MAAPSHRSAASPAMALGSTQPSVLGRWRRQQIGRISPDWWASGAVAAQAVGALRSARREAGIPARRARGRDYRHGMPGGGRHRRMNAWVDAARRRNDVAAGLAGWLARAPLLLGRRVAGGQDQQDTGDGAGDCHAVAEPHRRTTYARPDGCESVAWACAFACPGHRRDGQGAADRRAADSLRGREAAGEAARSRRQDHRW